ncbi:interleukin 12Ba [Pseudorasbora parva]|uniref:interleukin 12Ba n=1 Tax=Pseudorasbora parva TaxID=51549 RepID=UPI00351E800D
MCLHQQHLDNMFFLFLGVLMFHQPSAVRSIKTTESYWTLKPNVLVVNVDVGKDVNMVKVPLICGEAYEGQNITWTKNKDENLEAQGNRIMVTVEGWKGGNYSCFNNDGSYLNHTLVLAQWTFKKIIKNTPEKGYIHCSTNNYGGSFQCFWTWDVNRDGHVAHIKATRPHGGSNISCSLDSRGQSVTCLDQDYCPYSEEVERINLTIYFRSSFVVETYNIKFYIMDIVRPDMVAISRINQTSVEVGYPHSWSTPSSYFPLIFQVKEIHCRKNKKCDCSKPNLSETYLTQSHQLPVMKGMAVCVRAKDEFCNSSWSEWRLYKCRNRQNRKQRNQEPKLMML